MSRAYEHGDLSLVYPIARSTPAFLPLVAVPLFGEVLHPLGAARHRRRGRRDLARAPRAAASRARHRSRPATRYRAAHAARDGRLLADRQGGDGAARRARAWPGPVPRAIAYSAAARRSRTRSRSRRSFFRARERRRAARSRARAARAARAAAAVISFVGYALILRAFETALAATWWRCASRACCSRWRSARCGCASARPAARARRRSPPWSASR